MLSHPPASQKGFSLVELMVAMVIGLVVTGAVVAFIFSMMRANNQTLSATRLNSELRTSAELVSRELRRAAYLVDPIDGIGSGCRFNSTDPGTAPLCPFVAVRDVVISNGGNCLQFVYQVPTATTPSNRFQAIRVADGALLMGVGNAAVECNQATTRVSSDLLNLTPAANGTFSQNAGGGINVQMRGVLTGSPESVKEYLSVVAVRSGGV